jgi:hypothetical protein
MICGITHFQCTIVCGMSIASFFFYSGIPSRHIPLSWFRMSMMGWYASELDIVSVVRCFPSLCCWVGYYMSLVGILISCCGICMHGIIYLEIPSCSVNEYRTHARTHTRTHTPKTPEGSTQQTEMKSPDLHFQKEYTNPHI